MTSPGSPRMSDSSQLIGSEPKLHFPLLKTNLSDFLQATYFLCFTVNLLLQRIKVVISSLENQSCLQRLSLNMFVSTESYESVRTCPSKKGKLPAALFLVRVTEMLLSSASVILLQIVMVSPGTHLVKSNESQSRTIESQLKLKTSPKLKMLGPLCNQTVNIKTDSKTLYFSILKLKYNAPILKHNIG